MKPTVTILALCIIAASCSAPRLVLTGGTDDLKETYPVKGASGIMQTQELNFGDYHTTSIRYAVAQNGYLPAPPENVSWATHASGQQSIYYHLTGAWGLSADAYCVTGLDEEDVAAVKGANSVINKISALTGLQLPAGNMFAAILKTAGHHASWQMFTGAGPAQTTGWHLAGYMARDSDNYYTIYATGSNMKAAGYEFRNRANQTVAVVSLQHKEVVVLAHVAAEEKFLLANACTAILLKALLVTNSYTRR